MRGPEQSSPCMHSYMHRFAWGVGSLQQRQGPECVCAKSFSFCRDKVAQAEAALSGGAEQLEAAAAELQRAAAAAARAAAT